MTWCPCGHPLKILSNPRARDHQIRTNDIYMMYPNHSLSPSLVEKPNKYSSITQNHSSQQILLPTTFNPNPHILYHENPFQFMSFKRVYNLATEVLRLYWDVIMLRKILTILKSSINRINIK